MYEEKMIKGRMHYRLCKGSQWTKYTIAELHERYGIMLNHVLNLEDVNAKQKDFIEHLEDTFQTYTQRVEEKEGSFTRAIGDTVDTLYKDSVSLWQKTTKLLNLKGKSDAKREETK